MSHEKKEETGPYAYTGTFSNSMYTIVKIDSSICLKINAVGGGVVDTGAMRYNTCDMDFLSYLLRVHFPNGGYTFDTLPEIEKYRYKVTGMVTFHWDAPTMTLDWQPVITFPLRIENPQWLAHSMTAGLPLTIDTKTIWDRMLPEIDLVAYRLDFTRVIKQ